jgi:hypothetical protein
VGGRCACRAAARAPALRCRRVRRVCGAGGAQSVHGVRMAPPPGSTKATAALSRPHAARSHRLAQRRAQDGHSQYSHFTQHLAAHVRLLWSSRCGGAFPLAALPQVCNGCVRAHAAWRGGVATQARARCGSTACCDRDAAARRGGRRARRARGGSAKRLRRSERKPRCSRPAGRVHHRARCGHFPHTHERAAPGLRLHPQPPLAWTWQRAGARAV